jgi:hypothetical protein
MEDALRWIEGKQKIPQAKISGDPCRVKLGELTTIKALFQPRQRTYHDHVSNLRDALRISGDLDPISVWCVGDAKIPLDGHHSLEAYVEERRKDIPVVPFAGTLEQALAVVGKENAKIRKSFTRDEKLDYALRLMKLCRLSKGKIKALAKVSDGSLGNMRRAFKELGVDEKGKPIIMRYTTWREARAAWEGKIQHELTPEQIEAKFIEDVGRVVDSLSRHYGASLHKNTIKTAHALKDHFGALFPQLVGNMQDLLEDEEPAEDAEDF